MNTLRDISEGPRRSQPSRHVAVPERPGLPLLGNLIPYVRDPLAVISAVAREQGSIAAFRVGPLRYVLLSDAAANERVLTAPYAVYDKDVFDYKLLSQLLGDGLLTSDGETWLHERRRLQPAFHRERILALGTMMVERTEAMLEGWDAQGERPIDVHAQMMRLTLQIVGLALFGIDLGAEASSVGRALAVALETLVAPEMLLFSQWPPWLVTPNRTRFCAALRELHCVVDEILDERLREREPRNDFLGLLLEAHASQVQPAARPQIRDEIMTLLLAGHETTASALTWTWWLLSGDATVERRMLAELAQQLGSRAIRSPDVERLPYLRAVIDETMRPYPPPTGSDAVRCTRTNWAAMRSPPVRGLSRVRVHDTPQSSVLARARAFRPVAFCRTTVAGTTRFCVLPVRWRPAHVYRRAVCVARTATRRSHDRATRAFRTSRRRDSRSAGVAYAPPATRSSPPTLTTVAQHDGRALRARKRYGLSKCLRRPFQTLSYPVCSVALSIA